MDGSRVEVSARTRLLDAAALLFYAGSLTPLLVLTATPLATKGRNGSPIVPTDLLGVWRLASGLSN